MSLAVEINDGSNGGQHVEEDVTTQKEVGSTTKCRTRSNKLICWAQVATSFLSYQTEKTKWETLRVLNKLEGDGEQKTGMWHHLEHCVSCRSEM